MDLIERTGNQWRHPWELSRGQCLLGLLRENDRTAAYADIGAGDRFFARQLRAVTSGAVLVVDTEYPRQRTTEDGMVCLNDVSLIGPDGVDHMIMMDVLEHVGDEGEFLRAVLGALKPGGKVFVTVPALQFLFSSHDQFLRHQRRYSRKQLLDVLRGNGMQVEQCHYFYTMLFPLRGLIVLCEKVLTPGGRNNTDIGMWRHDADSWLTRLLVYALNMDFSLNRLLDRWGVHLPGLSLVAVCRKAP